MSISPLDAEHRRCYDENGCLVVVPVTHESKRLEHERPDFDYVNFLDVGVKGMGEQTQRIHLETERGDTIVFHPILLHGSGQNRSSGLRRAIYVPEIERIVAQLPEAARAGFLRRNVLRAFRIEA
jgi:ectoine hydroxylase-related dioxygenase (phytanoyl-CoA dioxygenase family)